MDPENPRKVDFVGLLQRSLMYRKLVEKLESLVGNQFQLTGEIAIDLTQDPPCAYFVKHRVNNSSIELLVFPQSVSNTETLVRMNFLEELPVREIIGNKSVRVIRSESIENGYKRPLLSAIVDRQERLKPWDVDGELPEPTSAEAQGYKIERLNEDHSQVVEDPRTLTEERLNEMDPYELAETCKTLLLRTYSLPDSE